MVEAFAQRGVSRWRRSGRTGKVNWEQDTLYSEDFGFSIAAGSATDITVYVVPSGKTFHIKSLKLHNTNSNAVEVRLFASTGGGLPMDRFWVAAADDFVLGPGDYQGLKFSSTQNVYAQVFSTSTGITIFAGGQVRDSDA
jgi:hypothetical protein